MFKNSELKDFETRELYFKDYKDQAPALKEINWYDLPDTLCLELRGLKFKRRGKSTTVKKLKKLFGEDKKINNNVQSIFTWRYNKRYSLPIKLPFNLINADYVKLYSLMASEGSYNNKFTLHVPEEHLHTLFQQTLTNLFGDSIKSTIKTIISHGIKMQYASQIVRYFIPIPDHIPNFILKNKEFAREYLKIAFESEGCALLNKEKHKRYIKLARNISVEELINVKLKYKPGTRVFLRQLKKDYPNLYKEIFNKAPLLLLGESLLLSHYFNIETTLRPEALLINKTGYRRGFYSVRWNLLIYADSIDRFIKEINFMSERKRKICEEMLKFKSNKPAFFALRIMKKVSRDNVFRAKDFNQEMKRRGYISPGKYIWFYNKKWLIKRIKKGHYKLT